MKELCCVCHKRPVEVKKRQLCRKCYQQQYIAGTFGGLPLEMNIEHTREMEFMKNYFDDFDDCLYEPATFSMKGVKYTPDFYDIDRNVWIEVVGTREAYRQNRKKYSLFRYHFPDLILELRAPCGQLIDEPEDGGRVPWPASVYHDKERMRKYHERRKNNEKRS